MDNIEDTNYKFNSQDIENIWYIFFCLADSTFFVCRCILWKKRSYMLSGETMMSICKTLETIDFVVIEMPTRMRILYYGSIEMI